MGSIAINLNSWASIVGEVGGIHVSSIHGTDVDANALTFFFGGLRFRSSVERHSLRLYKSWPDLRVPTLSFNKTVTTSSFHGFAMAPGVGLDWNVTHHVGLRLGQVDYLLTRMPTSTNQVTWNNFRYSAGVVFRF